MELKQANSAVESVKKHALIALEVGGRAAAACCGLWGVARFGSHSPLAVAVCCCRHHLLHPHTCAPLPPCLAALMCR